MYYRFSTNSLVLLEGMDPYEMVIEIKESHERFANDYGIAAGYYTTFEPDGWAISLRRMKFCA